MEKQKKPEKGGNEASSSGVDLMLQETLEGKSEQFQLKTGEGIIIVPVNY